MVLLTLQKNCEKVFGSTQMKKLRYQTISSSQELRLFRTACQTDVSVPDEDSELNEGCAGLNQGSAAQMLNWGNHTAEPR